jgi:hypothetical protein
MDRSIIVMWTDKIVRSIKGKNSEKQIFHVAPDTGHQANGWQGRKWATTDDNIWRMLGNQKTTK